MLTSDLEGLGEENHFDLYGLNDHWPDNWSYSYRNHRKALVVWNQVSPSQVENYVKCPRAWFFKSVLRIPEAQKGHQALGTSFHLILEKIPKGLSHPVKADTNATDEEWDKAKQLAQVALPLLPSDPNQRIKREHGITLDTWPGGPRFVGYIDLAIPPGIGWPAFLIPPNEAIVGDYKTLSDFRYMKTPEELANSVQMMSYAKGAISEWPGGLVGEHDAPPEEVRLLHMYAKTRGNVSRASIRNESALVTLGQINSFWNKTLDTVREMEQIATNCTNPDDVAPTGTLNGHCNAYGGCAFRDKCGISKESSIKTLFQIGKKPEQTTQDPPNMSGSAILAKIQAARAAAQGSNPNITPNQEQQSTPAPVAAATPTPSTVQANPLPANTSMGDTGTGPLSGLMAKFDAQGKGRPTLTGVAAESYAKERGISPAPDGTMPGVGDLSSTRCNNIGELVKLASGIVPPDAPSRAQEIITKPGDPVVDNRNVSTEGDEDDEEESTTPAPGANMGTASTSSPTPPAGPEPVKRRGRPSKEEMAAREAAAQAEFNARVEAEVAKRSGQPIVKDDPVIAKLMQDQADEIIKLRGESESLRNIAKAWRDKAEAEANRPLIVSPAADGPVIYVDCFPVKGQAEITDYFEWIGPIAKAVAESNGVSDYRLINYTAKGLLATAIRELVKTEGMPKAMTIPSYAAGADIALEILTPLAKRVIKKV